MSPTPLVGSTCAEPRPLFAWVPIPKMREPDNVATPGDLTAGRVISDPLLSRGRSDTGFCNCLLRGTRVAEQAPCGQEKYTGGALRLAAHPSPQSCAKTPMPRMPLAPSDSGVSAALSEEST